MTFRITLTAIALGTMALAGCASTNNDAMMATPAPAPMVAPPATPSDVMVDGDFQPGNQTAVNSNRIMSGSDGVTNTDGGGRPAGPTVNDAMVDGDFLEGNQTAVNSNRVMSGSDGVTNTDGGIRQGTVAGQAPVSAEAAMMQSAMDACFESGGQVVSWVGDPSGATQACRRSDGLEYRLADARYYQ